ncbi:MAG: glycosyltransferase [Candidatus Parcubacteria bacterium]|nr:glycosyltransferase [Candidatus Parcubacteria bacterium]
MTIHFFTKGDKNAGSSRQRAFLMAEELNKRGIKAIVHQPPLILASITSWLGKFRLLLQYLKIFKDIKKDDIIYLQRAIYNKYFFILIIFYKLIFRRKMIFDFDDAIYMHSFSKTKTLSKMADAVVVGSHALAEWAKKYNKNVYIIPTCVKFENYEKFSQNYFNDNRKIVIGWIGGAIDQYENLKLLVPALERLTKNGIFIKFILIGALKYQKVYDLFQNIRGIETEFIDALDWNDPTAVPAHIQKFDVGVMPLLDNEWNRGKCAFKAIEYMACGVATVCSAVGECKFLIKDGLNGFLAKNVDELFVRIRQLALDKELRIKLGKEGQKTIYEEYSYKANIPKLIGILQKI